jgi:cytokinin dehydrogenase
MADERAGFLRALTAIPEVELVDDAASSAAAASDFGGLVTGVVGAIAIPRTIEALAAVVAAANRHGVQLTPRGLGYSQSGQSIPKCGVTLDTRRFADTEIDAEDCLVHCGAGVTWRALLAAAARHGLAPTVMPLNLDLTVGGTLSAGGMGSTSHRFGLAVSSVVAIHVVTGGAEQVVATTTENRELYDAVLGGIGQFGILCTITMRLRRLLPMTRTYCLLYDDFATLLEDEQHLMELPWCTHIEGFASAAIQGMRRSADGRRVPFARWFGGLHMSTEFEPSAPPDDDAFLHDLRFRELLHIEDNDSVEYAARYDGRFAMMRATGAWQQIHPWLECVLPYDGALAFLRDVMPSLPLLLGDGHRIMPIANRSRPAFVMMPGAPMIGIAVLPAGIPKAFEPAALGALRELDQWVRTVGGKRYLSGWLFEPDEAAWRAHYGDAYDEWRAAKRLFDPRNVLGSTLRPLPPLAPPATLVAAGTRSTTREDSAPTQRAGARRRQRVARR